MIFALAMKHSFREKFIRTRDKINQTLAWWLPKRIAYWAAIRVAAYATTGKYGNTIVPDLAAMDAIKRFGDDHQL